MASRKARRSLAEAVATVLPRWRRNAAASSRSRRYEDRVLSLAPRSAAIISRKASIHAAPPIGPLPFGVQLLGRHAHADFTLVRLHVGDERDHCTVKKADQYRDHGKEPEKGRHETNLLR